VRRGFATDMLACPYVGRRRVVVVDSTIAHTVLNPERGALGFWIRIASDSAFLYQGNVERSFSSTKRSNSCTRRNSPVCS
jgi:hypothetical protein